MSRDGVIRSVVVCVLSLLPTVARAQAVTTGSIAGVVRDTSGAVLPGVTVEAASPALIQKVRTAVTDGEGRYTIVDLRPGTYTVSFTLTGFRTVRREGIALSAGFAATVNADLRVGSLEETITVTGESPIVDTQSVRQQKVVSDELLGALPSGGKGDGGIARLVPGMSGGTDVGGGPRSFTLKIRGLSEAVDSEVELRAELDEARPDDRQRPPPYQGDRTRFDVPVAASR